MNRYQIIDELGEGASGTVYLAFDRQRSQKVAIKMLRHPTPEALRRFDREGRILWEQIDNKFVVDLLDVNLTAARPYLVMEYCPHGSLRAWVSERRAWREVVTAVAQAILGLHGIHRAEGFHRDIKPENLLVGVMEGRCVVKVADFGIARVPITTSLPMTRSGGGTIGYIAPEILVGQPFSRAADVYSMGVVLQELLVGSGSALPCADMPGPPALRNLVAAMVHSDPAQRPDCRQIADQLRALLASPPVTNRAPAAAPKAKGAGLALGGLFLGGLLLRLAALTGRNDSEWDKTVGRYRGPDGKFTTG